MEYLIRLTWKNISPPVYFFTSPRPSAAKLLLSIITTFTVLYVPIERLCPDWEQQSKALFHSCFLFKKKKRYFPLHQIIQLHFTTSKKAISSTDTLCTNSRRTKKTATTFCLHNLSIHILYYIRIIYTKHIWVKFVTLTPSPWYEFIIEFEIMVIQHPTQLIVYNK